MIRIAAIALIAWLSILATACAQWGGQPGPVDPQPSCCPEGNCALGPLVPVAPIERPWQPPRRVRATPAEQPAAVAKLRCGSNMGSAVLVYRDETQGIVLTVNHAVAEGGIPQLDFPDGNRYSATVLGTDPTWDVAVLRIKAPSATPLEIAQDAPPVGAAVTLAGFSMGRYRATTGRVVGYASPYRDGFPGDWLQASPQAMAGDSGAPLLDDRGRVVALCWGGKVIGLMVRLGPAAHRVPVYNDSQGACSTGTVCTRLREILRRYVRPTEKPEGPGAGVPPQLPPAGGGAPGSPLVEHPAPITPDISPRPADCREQLAALNAKLACLQGQLAAVEGREGKPGPAGPGGPAGKDGKEAGPAGPAGPKGERGEAGHDGKDVDPAAVLAKLPGFKVQILDKNGKLLQQTHVRLGGTLRFQLKPTEPKQGTAQNAG